MLGSAIYGASLGLGSVAVARLAPQPIGWVLWWAFLAGQLGWASVVTWRRTALPFATTAMLLGAIAAGFLALLSAAGFVLPELPLRLALPVGCLVVASSLCLFLESRVHRPQWLCWKEHMSGQSAGDIVLARHIPNLRRGA
jgi:hypothetical protein